MKFTITIKDIDDEGNASVKMEADEGSHLPSGDDEYEDVTFAQKLALVTLESIRVLYPNGGSEGETGGQ